MKKLSFLLCTFVLFAVTLTEDCVTVFTPSADGKSRYQLVGDNAFNQRILNQIRDVTMRH